jgi:hypothetical protein
MAKMAVITMLQVQRIGTKLAILGVRAIGAVLAFHAVVHH